MIKAESVGVIEEANTPLFKGLDVVVNPGDKIGVVGTNGSGKTTLLHLLAGTKEPTVGVVTRSSDETVVMSEQPDNPAQSLREFVGEGLGEVYRLHAEMESMADSLGYDAIAMLHYGEVLERFESLSGWSQLAYIDAALSRVGLSEIAPTQTVGTLSGGQLARAVIARMLARRPTTLLLDEPTNHLDRAGIEWLSEYLASSAESVMLVTYNRAILDQLPHKIIEIDDLDGTAEVYRGNYSTYLLHRAEKDRRRRQLVQAQEAYRQRLESDVARSKQRARSLEGSTRNAGIRSKAKGIARQAKARQRRLQSLLDSAAWVSEQPQRERHHWTTPTASEIQPASLQLKDVTFRFGEKRVLDDVSFTIKPGDRVLLEGDNGSGKSTLLKIIGGQLQPESGSMATPEGSPTYLPQQVALPADTTPMQYFRRHVGVYIEEAQAILSAFLFDYESWSGPIGRLSQGEKRRLQIAVTLNKPSGLHLIDEPTNYLDFEGLELFETALETIRQTLVVVSHDEYFCRAVNPTLVCRMSRGRLVSTEEITC